MSLQTILIDYHLASALASFGLKPQKVVPIIDEEEIIVETKIDSKLTLTKPLENVTNENKTKTSSTPGSVRDSSVKNNSNIKLNNSMTPKSNKQVNKSIPMTGNKDINKNLNESYYGPSSSIQKKSQQQTEILEFQDQSNTLGYDKYPNQFVKVSQQSTQGVFTTESNESYESSGYPQNNTERQPAPPPPPPSLTVPPKPLPIVESFPRQPSNDYYQPQPPPPNKRNNW